MNHLKINNTWIRLLAAAPVIGGILELITILTMYSSEYKIEQALVNHELWYVTVIVNIVFALLDERKLKQAGIDTKAFGKMFFIIPVYMWMRAKHLEQKPIYFWVWVGAFVLSIFLF